MVWSNFSGYNEEHHVKCSEPTSNFLINYRKKRLEEILTYSFKAPALKTLLHNHLKTNLQPILSAALLNDCAPDKFIILLE